MIIFSYRNDKYRIEKSDKRTIGAQRANCSYGRLVGRMDEQAIAVASLLKGAKIWDIKFKKKIAFEFLINKIIS